MDLFRNVDIEGADCGWRGVRRRGRLRLGRVRRRSALLVRVALAHYALALVCARERERTARQPSKALHGDLPSAARAPVGSSGGSVLRSRYGARMRLPAGGKVKLGPRSGSVLFAQHLRLRFSVRIEEARLIDRLAARGHPLEIGGQLPCGARHLWLPRRESSRARARRCRRRTIPTSGASERSVRTRHGASLPLRGGV